MAEAWQSDPIVQDNQWQSDPVVQSDDWQNDPIVAEEPPPTAASAVAAPQETGLLGLLKRPSPPWLQPFERTVQKVAATQVVRGPTEEQYQKAIEQGLPESVAGPLMGVTETLTGLTRLDNIAIATLTGGLGGVAGRVVAGGFATQMARQFPELWQAFQDAPDLATKGRILGQMAATAGFAFLGARHAIRGPKVEPVPVPEITERRFVTVPEVAEAGEMPVPPVTGPAPAIELQLGLEPAKGPGTAMPSPKIILNRVFGGGLGDKVKISEDRAMQLEGTWTRDMKDLGLNKLTEAEKTNLTDVLEAVPEATPATERVAKLADFFRTAREDISTRYQALGAQVVDHPLIRNESGSVIQVASAPRPFEPLPNYVPREISWRGVVEKDPKDFAKYIYDNNRNMGLSPNDASDVVTYLRGKALGEATPDGLIDNPDVLRLVRGSEYSPVHLHSRSALNLPSDIYKPINEALPNYFHAAARELGILENLGPDADVQVRLAAEKLGPNNPDVATAMEQWDNFTGRSIQRPSELRTAQKAHIVNNLAAASLMGPATAISQISQAAALSGRFGYRKLATALAKTMLTREGRIQPERAGTFLKSLRDEYSLSSKITPKMTKLQKTEQITSKLASGIIELQQVGRMDRFWRRVGFHAAKADLVQSQRRLLSGRGTKADLARIKEAGIEAHATAAELERGASSLSRKYNVSTQWSELPSFLQTAHGQFARGLQTFFFQNSRLMWDSFIKPATKGNVAPLLRLIASGVITGEIIGDTRRWLAGRASDRPGGSLPEFLDDVINGRKTSTELAHRALDDLAWAGTLGIAQNMYEPIAFGQSLSEQTGRMTSMFAGAGIGNIAELGAGLSQFLVGGAKAMRNSPDQLEDEKNKAQIQDNLRTGTRILARRLPFVGQIGAARAFPSERGDRRVATEGIKRAMRRGNSDQANEWAAWFEARHPGERIGDRAFTAQ